MELGTETRMSEEEARKSGLKTGTVAVRHNLRADGTRWVLAEAGRRDELILEVMSSCPAIVAIRPMCRATKFGPVRHDQDSNEWGKMQGRFAAEIARIPTH